MSEVDEEPPHVGIVKLKTLRRHYHPTVTFP